MMTTRLDEYLGDGVYASFDGEYIWLETERGKGAERIALDPYVFRELLRYAKQFDHFPRSSE